MSGDFISIRADDTDMRWPVLETNATAHKGWIWSRIVLLHANREVTLHGLAHTNAQQMLLTLAENRQEALRRLQADLHSDHKRLEPVWTDLSAQLNAPRYLAARDRKLIAQSIADESHAIEAAFTRAQSPHSKSMAITAKVLKIVKQLRPFTENCADELNERNRYFVNEELNRWRVFFNHCEERPLTNEQARAAITFEENTLLVAAAGSGKTSTVVGKVAYALAKGIARPEDILCLAFNSKAADEIGMRIKTRLTAMTQPNCPIDPQVKAIFAALLSTGAMIESRTFHSLGRKIVTELEGRNFLVSKGDESNQRLKRAIEQCQHNPEFQAKWLLLQTIARFARPVDSRFRNETAYLEYLRGIWQQRKQADGILSLGCTKPVRSFEEVAISNWLYVMGVEFEYEAPFIEGTALLCPGKSWTPDFTYRIKNAQCERVVIHEHFALNAHGDAPTFFKDPARYKSEACEKQETLRKLDTLHFWTTSAEYIEGSLFTKLEAKLRAAGVQLQPRDTDDVLRRLKEIGLLPDNDLIGRAVSQMRQNGWDRSTLESRLHEQPEPARARLFLDVICPVAEAVKQLLVVDKCLDYDEMIRRALVHLSKKPNQQPYKFILADEFQDTAPGRGEMVRRMLHAYSDSFFFAVGDDWQAINRFAGSDLRFFKDFGDKFNIHPKADQRCDLTQTFRSNQGIADAARHFILKNKSQIPKEVEADDKTWEGVIDICTYSKDNEVLSHIETILQRWVDQHSGEKKPSVFILGRYGEKRVQGLSETQINELHKRWSDRLDLVPTDGQKPKPLYLTMHKSKGLQADYVLILGMFRVEYDFFCFPSEREDDPLLQLVLPPKEALSDADERRLFYVALTRAKKQVVLLAQDIHPSPYALEMLLDHRDGKVLFNGTKELPPICPACKAGLVFSRYNYKSNRPFFACSDRHGCGKTWSQWPQVK